MPARERPNRREGSLREFIEVGNLQVGAGNDESNIYYSDGVSKESKAAEGN